MPPGPGPDGPVRTAPETAGDRFRAVSLSVFLVTRKIISSVSHALDKAAQAPAVARSNFCSRCFQTGHGRAPRPSAGPASRLSTSVLFRPSFPSPGLCWAWCWAGLGGPGAHVRGQSPLPLAPSRWLSVSGRCAFWFGASPAAAFLRRLGPSPSRQPRGPRCSQKDARRLLSRSTCWAEQQPLPATPWTQRRPPDLREPPDPPPRALVPAWGVRAPQACGVCCTNRPPGPLPAAPA